MEKIPDTTVTRLSIYYRALEKLKENGVETTSSERLSELVGFTAAQIRKDLAYFGQFGVPGRGYDVILLQSEVAKVLGIDRRWRCALVGVGHLGYALLAYKGFKQQGYDIVCAFDNDPDKIGKTWQRVRVYAIDDAPDIMKEEDVEMGIIAVPSDAAPRIVRIMTEAGIKSILSFVPHHTNLPDGINYKQVDLAMELEWLSYYASRK
ncbi:MAG: redox-sensing transcriptional repressor Rex [bacterium]|nr:redox-sensing transcriptional repressor Rex [bacterium]